MGLNLVRVMGLILFCSAGSERSLGRATRGKNRLNRATQYTPCRPRPRFASTLLRNQALCSALPSGTIARAVVRPMAELADGSSACPLGLEHKKTAMCIESDAGMHGCGKQEGRIPMCRLISYPNTPASPGP